MGTDADDRDVPFAQRGIRRGVVSVDNGLAQPSAQKAASIPAQSPSRNLALTGIAINSRAIGGVFRVRRGFRSEPFIVVGQTATHYKGIWPSGEAELRPHARLRDPVVPVPASIRSYGGRLWNLLRVPATNYLTEASSSQLRKLVDSILGSSDPRYAVGVLLDRKGLSLTEAECLALPLESWRVRYELLQDHAAGTPRRRDLAAEVVRDGSAPRGLRLRIALAEGLDLGHLGPDIAALFTDAVVAERVRTDVNNTVATEIAAALEDAGSPEAARLRVAVANPSWFAASSHNAAAFAVLAGRKLPPGQKVDVDGMPASVVDDLIDAGVPVGVSDGVGAAVGHEMWDVPLSVYVTGRLRPADLTTDEVVKLKFAAEAYRRYLAGDDGAASALPDLRLKDANVARSLRRGEDPLVEPQDPMLAELVAIIRSGGEVTPSDEVLADQSTWAALVSKGVRGASANSEAVASNQSAGAALVTKGLGGAPEIESGIERFADLAALHQARMALFEWDWARAKTVARDRLRVAKREAVRDELLNIVACATWLQGKAEPALAALDKALEGEYTDALLTNAAVIATDLEHWSAIERFVKIAREAPGPNQRAMAAERALMLWANDDARIWDDDDEGIPDEILGALRPLIGEPIPEERYLRILRTLAAHDDDWLAGQPSSAFGPHAKRAFVRIFKARANGIDAFAAALAKELKSGSTEKWVEDERDSVVTAAIKVLTEQNDDMRAAYFGMTLLQAGIPLEPMQQVPLVCFTVASITQNINPDEGEPKDEFIDWVFGAKRALSSLDSDQRALFKPLVTIAGEALARAYALARAPQISQGIDAFNKVNNQLRTVAAWQVNHDAVQRAMSPISELCRDVWSVLNKVRPLIEDRDLLKFVDDLMGAASELGNKAVKIR